MKLSPVNAARIEQIVIGLLVAGMLYVSMIIYGQLVCGRRDRGEVEPHR